MSRGGWIKLYRSIEDSVLSDNKPYDYTHAWIWLIMEAQSKDKEVLFNNQLMKIKRGDCLTSVRKLAHAWGWGRDKVLRFLHMLEELKMIQIKSDEIKKNGTLLSIVKYSDFQDGRDTQKTPNGQLQEHRKDTNKNTNKDGNPNTYPNSDKDNGKDIDPNGDPIQTRNKEYKEKEKEINKEKESAFGSPSREGSPAPEEENETDCYLFDGNGEWV